MKLLRISLRVEPTSNTSCFNFCFLYIDILLSLEFAITFHFGDGNVNFVPESVEPTSLLLTRFAH